MFDALVAHMNDALDHRAAAQNYQTAGGGAGMAVLDQTSDRPSTPSTTATAWRSCRRCRTGRSTCRSTRRRSPACTTTSSSERDLSNSRDYEEFFEHYGYVVARARPRHDARSDDRRALHGRAEPATPAATRCATSPATSSACTPRSGSTTSPATTSGRSR